MKEIKFYTQSTNQTFETYEKKFKALADQKGYTFCTNCVSVEKLVYVI